MFSKRSKKSQKTSTTITDIAPEPSQRVVSYASSVNFGGDSDDEDDVIINDKLDQDVKLKSGYQSLQQRLQCWAELATGKNKPKPQATSSSLLIGSLLPSKEAADEAMDIRGSLKQPGSRVAQFATLQELFANRQPIRSEKSTSNQQAHMKHGYDATKYDRMGRRRTKIPVMKLDKSDWNVKCWEDRLLKNRHQKQTSNDNDNDNNNKMGSKQKFNTIFKGRIDEVETKLEKMRDGLPLDEQLHVLNRLSCSGGLKGARCSPRLAARHEWTDLLKDELERQVHNQRVIKSQLLSTKPQSSSASALSLAMKPKQINPIEQDSNWIVKKTTNNEHCQVTRWDWPLRKPIGKIYSTSSSSSSSSSLSLSSNNPKSSARCNSSAAK